MAGPADTLGKELEAAQRLLQLLKQEEACLIKADVEGMSKLTAEKASLATQMTELARQRSMVLRTAGYENSESGVTAWMNSPDATDNDRSTWTELLSLAQAGKELNRTNGLLIAQQIACNQSALNVLQGNAQGGNVYGPNGQTATKIGGRRLVIG